MNDSLGHVSGCPNTALFYVHVFRLLLSVLHLEKREHNETGKKLTGKEPEDGDIGQSYSMACELWWGKIAYASFMRII